MRNGESFSFFELCYRVRCKPSKLLENKQNKNHSLYSSFQHTFLKKNCGVQSIFTVIENAWSTVRVYSEL